MDAIRCFIGKNQTNWDLHLSQISGALRSAVNRQTGFSANKLMLGREINLPAQLMFPHSSKESGDIDQYVSDLVKQVQVAHEVARNNLKTATKRMKRNYDIKILERAFAVGDAVYLLDTAVLPGKCKKLTPPWRGPAVIIEKLSAYIYRIKLRNSVLVVNHDRLKPCRDVSIPQWIVKWRENPQPLNDSMNEDDKVYCVCRKRFEGRFMIQCDFCNEWYHGSCINISPSEAVTIDKFKCEDCRKRNAR